MIDRTRLRELTLTYGTAAVEAAVIRRFLTEHGFRNTDLPNLVDISEDSFASMWLDRIRDARELATILETLIPQRDQKLNGAFFTPRYIVDFMIEQLELSPEKTILDPSCGSGAFLAGAVNYLQQKFGLSVKEIVKNNVVGVDILDYNVTRTKLVLSAMALENGEFLEDSDFDLSVGDSLRLGWNRDFDRIVGNPPYVKFQDLSDINREFLQGNWRTIEGGAFNLYFAFFELGFKLLSKDGRLAYITPNNYFTSLSGESLRRFFQQEKCVSRIVDFSHRKVFDAQTYTAITFIDRFENQAILYDRIKPGQEPQDFLATANGSPNFVSALAPKKWRLLKQNEREAINRIENNGEPLGQIFDIAVGIATLKDSVYFVEDRDDSDPYLWKQTSYGSFQIEKAVTRPVFKISDFSTQAAVSFNRRRVICPYNFETNPPRVIPEAQFGRDYPKCLEYLASEREHLGTRDKGKVEYVPFYSWGRTQGLAKTGKRLLTPTFSKTPRFLIVEDEDSLFTNGYGVFFRQDSPSSLFDTRHELARDSNIRIVQKILNSGLMNYYVTKTSVSIEGGYPCYQKNFIERFSIPDMSSEVITQLSKIEDRDNIDALLCDLYGIDPKVIQEIWLDTHPKEPRQSGRKTSSQ